MTPQRIQLRRTKGWRKPEGCIVVARPTYWGNPFRENDPHPIHGWPMSRQEAVDLYRGWLGQTGDTGFSRWVEARVQLMGYDLACWCAPTAPCHANLLISVANAVNPQAIIETGAVPRFSDRNQPLSDHPETGTEQPS